MNHKKNILIILILSSTSSLIGFLIDSDVRESEVLTNVFEIFMMTIILTTVLSIVYISAQFFNKIKKNS